MKKTRSKEEMLRLLQEQASSGQSKKSWCKSTGITEATFYYWQKKLHQETPKNDREIFPVFERIGIDATVDLELRLTDGRWLGVRTSSAASLRLLLEAMI